ncbi:MAG TPA: transglutaminase-like domain-containing protein [Syntrophales bacterium]|nr:transglutaminase-like domain-containing protein [Syntrophales bacterium]HOL58485.1 transglutaminase-like domain-containing protein [Syntrophales bacterium]HPO34907.1 transglutaminase-like domain-containing protein [Syntrophales bacterium]
MKKWLGFITAFAFLGLLLWKVGFHPGQINRLVPGSTPPSGPSEVWMEITQAGKTVGWSHRIIQAEKEGYDVEEEIVLRLKSMGVPQEVRCNLRGKLNQNRTLKEFRALVSSSFYEAKVEGKVEGHRLFLSSGGKNVEIPLPGVPLLPGDLCRSRVPGRLPMFDAVQAGVREAEVAYLGEEIREIGGQREKLSRLALTFDGMEENIWCNEKGEMVREEGPMGLVAERVSKKRVELFLTKMKGEIDLPQLVSLPAQVEIKDPGRLTRLTCRLEGVPLSNLFLQGGRQTWRNPIVTVEREDLSLRQKASAGESFPSWALAPTQFIQTGHPELTRWVKKITEERDPSPVKMRKIVHWVHRETEKWPVASLADSISILSHKKGDCTEHAILVTALGRTAGIPTAIETGLVYQKGRFFYHAWNAFYLENYGWVTADAVFDQIPADCTHIRLFRGDLQREITMLAALIGKLKLSVEEMKYGRP